MIISHKYKFIFVKTLKTAGTSIEFFLSNHCGPDDIVTPIVPYLEPHTPRNYEGYYNHMPAYGIRKLIDIDIWNSYFKFCVERNPWDKTISHYFSRRSRRNSDLTFEDYLMEKRFPINSPKYTDLSDPEKIIVDDILYYERLVEDLSRVFQRLGIAFNGSLGVNAKSDYRTDRRHYRYLYTARQAALVGEAFNHELSLHGYKF
jgi:hypothetical protein